MSGRIGFSVLFLFSILGPLAHATDCSTVTCYYVREGASGNGRDWNTAFGSLPATLVRGATYMVADGRYPSVFFNTPNSGSQYISIKKATKADHGTQVGWMDSYGDGQAQFGDITLVTDYLEFDGQVRNESNWSDGDAYGFRVISSFYSNEANFGRCSDNIVVKYVNVGGPYSTSFNSAYTGSAFYLGGFGDVCQNWTISRVFAHNADLIGQMAGVDNVLWEYSWLGLNWSKEIIRGQIRASNVTIRHNIFKDGCRDDHAPGTGCTAEIAFFGNGDVSRDDYNNAKIYGNVIWKTISQFNSDACIMIEGSAQIYNNSIYNNATAGQCRLSSKSGAIRNNVWYLPRGMRFGCSSTTCDSNFAYTSESPFIDIQGGNFNLLKPIAGASLGAPYNVDLLGRTRGADGVWDAGAYEYGSGSIGTLKAPTNLRIVGQ